MFVFMVKGTVEGGFAPTRQVPRQRRAGGGRRWVAARSTRLHLDSDGGDRLADLAQPLLEVGHELAQLGGDGGIGAQQRPALVVDRPGAQPAARPAGTTGVTAANRAFDRRSRSESRPSGALARSASAMGIATAGGTGLGGTGKV
jgi:hypothetical protein